MHNLSDQPIIIVSFFIFYVFSRSNTNRAADTASRSTVSWNRNMRSKRKFLSARKFWKSGFQGAAIWPRFPAKQIKSFSPGWEIRLPLFRRIRNVCYCINSMTVSLTVRCLYFLLAYYKLNHQNVFTAFFALFPELFVNFSLKNFFNKNIYFFPVVVRQGETYGPKDHNCLKEVIFERKCGHQVKCIDLWTK